MDEDYGATNVLYPIILSETGTFNSPILVQCLPKNYFAIVMKLLLKHHVPNYHLWRLLGLSKAGMIEHLHKVFDWISEGSSLVALDPQTGKVLGFIIGNIVDASDGHKEQEKMIKYETQEMKAAFDLYNFMYHSIDIDLVYKTDLIYIIRLWMIVPNTTRKTHVMYELFIALLKFCDILGIKCVTTIATKGNEKYVAKCFGFQMIKKVHYYEFFNDYDLNEDVLKQDFFGYLLTLKVEDTRRKQVLTDSQTECIILPELTKSKKKLWTKDYWQQLFWQALTKDYLSPTHIKKYFPNNILI